MTILVCWPRRSLPSRVDYFRALLGINELRKTTPTPNYFADLLLRMYAFRIPRMQAPHNNPPHPTPPGPTLSFAISKMYERPDFDPWRPALLHKIIARFELFETRRSIWVRSWDVNRLRGDCARGTRGRPRSAATA